MKNKDSNNAGGFQKFDIYSYNISSYTFFITSITASSV